MSRINTQIPTEIYATWMDRPQNSRRSNDTEGFVDEMWNTDKRLADTQANHYQYVMAVIRSAIHQ